MEFEGSTIRIDLATLNGPRPFLRALWRWSFGAAMVQVARERPWDLVILVALILVYLLPGA